MTYLKWSRPLRHHHHEEPAITARRQRGRRSRADAHCGTERNGSRLRRGSRHIACDVDAGACIRDRLAHASNAKRREQPLRPQGGRDDECRQEEPSDRPRREVVSVHRVGPSARGRWLAKMCKRSAAVSDGHATRGRRPVGAERRQGTTLGAVPPRPGRGSSRTRSPFGRSTCTGGHRI